MYQPQFIKQKDVLLSCLFQFVKRHIESRGKNALLKLYKSIVRHYLKYAACTSNSYIECIERVQHRAAKCIN